MEVTRLKSADCKELAAFLDKVFTEQNGVQMDFLNTFPRIFRENDENMSWYYAVKENGKIIGTAASHPLFYRVGDEVLKISGGGNVAVSPEHRGRGIMQALLHRINEDLGEFDLACLHGDRKRYRTFGFERCGTEYLCYFTASMLSIEGCRADVTLADLREHPACVAPAMAVGKAQISGYERSAADFITALSSRGQAPLAVLREGTVIGYAAVDRDAYIGEIALADPADFGSLLAAILARFGSKGTIALRLPAYEHGLVRQMLRLCSRWQIIQPANFQIRNFAKVVRVFLKAKGLYRPLTDGVLTLDTELFGKWKIACEKGEVTVEAFDGTAEIFLPGYRVYDFLFGPNDPFLAHDVPAEKAALAANWLPLPLYCPHLS